MIRIGIVGCGRILAAHLRGYRLLREAGVEDFEITALCSRRADDARSYIRRGGSPPQRRAVSDRPGDPLAIAGEYLSDFQPTDKVEVYTDYRELVARAPIDAVNDFSSHALHHQVARAAFERGRDLMTQKPLALTVSQARRMCEEAEARDLVFGVFENARFRPAARQARWLVDSGRLGAVQMVLLGNVGTWWAPDRIVAETPWRHRRSEGGGIALDLAVHQFHLVRQIAGEVRTLEGRAAILEPRRRTLDTSGKVLAEIDCDAEDTIYSSFETERGATGALWASWAGHGGSTAVAGGPVIYTERGRIADGLLHRTDAKPEDVAELYRKDSEASRRKREFPFGLTDPFALAQYDWLSAVRDRREPETSGREGLRDLACAYAVLESDRAGRRVEIEEVLEGELSAVQKALEPGRSRGGKR